MHKMPEAAMNNYRGFFCGYTLPFGCIFLWTEGDLPVCSGAVSRRMWWGTLAIQHGLSSPEVHPDHTGYGISTEQLLEQASCRNFPLLCYFIVPLSTCRKQPRKEPHIFCYYAWKYFQENVIFQSNDLKWLWFGLFFIFQSKKIYWIDGFFGKKKDISCLLMFLWILLLYVIFRALELPGISRKIRPL